MRVLLVRTDRLGDVILTTPVATLLKRLHTEVRVEMLVAPWVAPLVRLHRDVDDVFTEEGNRRGSFRSLVSLLRSRGYDAAVLLHPKPHLALALWAARVSVRIGTRYRAYSFLLNVRVPVHRRNSGLHELELNLRTASPLGLAAPDPAESLFRFHVPAPIRESVTRKLAAAGCRPDETGIVLHPGSGGSARDWPVHRFAELADLLADRGYGPVWVTGSKSERELVDKLVRASSAPLVRLDGKLDLQELAGLLQRARLAVANSTGPLHLAVAMGTPVVGLYCPVSDCHPRRWGPYGRPDSVLMPDVPECRRCDPGCEYFDCMERITAEAALRKAEHVLRRQETMVDL